MSDAELEAIAGGGGGNPAPPDFSGMSDADLERIAGGGAKPELQEFKPLFDFGDQSAGHRADQLMGRSVLKGVGSGFLGLAGLGADAAVNAAYGAKKLASKTGLVEAPNPKNYYGKDGGYLPVTSGISNTTERGLDAAGFPKPETAGERVAGAAIEGAAGGVGGFLAGKVAQAGRGLGAFMAQTPAAAQAVSGAAAGAAGAGAAEGMDSPLGRQLPDWTPAAVGIVAGAATGAAGGALQRSLARSAAGEAPTREALAAGRDAAYTRARGSGVEVTQPAFARLHDAIRQDLDAAGIYRDLDPGPAASRLLAPFQNSRDAAAPVPLDRLEGLRKNAGALSTSADPTEQRVAAIIRSRMDDFVNRQAAPADFIEPNAGAAQRALGDLREGRALHARVRKDSALEDALTRTGDRTGRTGSGANLQNVERQEINKLITPGSAQARRVGLNAEETAQAREIVRGSRTENLLRTLGKFAPSGPVSAIPSMAGIGAGAQFGGTTGALIGAATPIAGYLAKGAAERIQRGKVDRLSDTIRRGYAVDLPNTNGATTGAVGGFLANDDRKPRRAPRYR